MNGVENNGHGRITFKERPAKARKSAKKTLKVAIIGKAPSSRMMAPFSDPSWEIWGLSNCYSFCPRLSRTFELHDLDAGSKRWNPEYMTWLASKHDFPLYVQREHPLAPHAVPFPRADVEREAQKYMPAGHRPYINNTVSWLIAMAIMEGATELALYGVDMAQHGTMEKSEYAHQRPSCEFWLGVAAAKGCKVHVPAESDLLKISKLYGFESHGAMRTKLDVRLKELRERKKSCEQIMEAKRLEAHVLHGAVDDMEYIMQWMGEEGFGNEYSNR